MNRRISEVLDPSPTEKKKKRLKAFFRNECVFCGEKLGKAEGDTHFDHLVAASAGGGNGLSNRVIACSRCNVKEKRDTDWEPFLHTKCVDDQTFTRRRELILDWRRESEAAGTFVPSPELLVAMKRAEDTIVQFENDIKKIEEAAQRQRVAR